MLINPAELFFCAVHAGLDGTHTQPLLRSHLLLRLGLDKKGLEGFSEWLCHPRKDRGNHIFKLLLFKLLEVAVRNKRPYLLI